MRKRETRTKFLPIFEMEIWAMWRCGDCRQHPPHSIVVPSSLSALAVCESVQVAKCAVHSSEMKVCVSYYAPIDTKHGKRNIRPEQILNLSPGRRQPVSLFRSYRLLVFPRARLFFHHIPILSFRLVLYFISYDRFPVRFNSYTLHTIQHAIPSFAYSFKTFFFFRPFSSFFMLVVGLAYETLATEYMCSVRVETETCGGNKSQTAED